jgi:hypothetical protein
MQLANNYNNNYESMVGGGITKYTGLDGREIAMANNLLWQLNLDSLSHNVPTRRSNKMVVINHLIHTKTKTQCQGEVQNISLNSNECAHKTMLLL